MTERIRSMEGYKVWDDGGLTCDNPYMSYEAGRDTAVLDGEFTLEELEAIAEFMKESKKKKGP